MKIWLACASALVLAAACGSSKEATAALEAMNLGSGDSGMIRYESKSGSGSKITLKNVVLGPEGEALKAKTLTFDGLDVTEAGKPLFTSAALKGIQMEQDVPGVRFNLDSVSIDKVNPAVGEFLASAFSEAGPGEAPAFEAWEMGGFSVNGMAVNVDLAQMGMGAGSVNVFMKEMSISDLKNTIFGAGKFDGFKGDFNIPAEAGLGYPIVGKFDFGTGQVKGVRGGIFADAISAGMAAAMDPDAMATLQADIMASMTSPLEAGYDSLTWTPVLIEASGAKLSTTAVKQTVTRNGDGVAVAISSPRSSVSFTTDASGGQLGQMAGMFLSMVGYPTIELYAGGEATFDPSTDVTRYTDYSFGLTDGFDLTMKGGFLGLKEAIGAVMTAFSAFDPMTGGGMDPDLSGLSVLQIVDLDITLTDKSFVNKMLSLAPMMGVDPEAMRNDIVSMLTSSGADFAEAGVDPAISNELTAAVAAFVQRPGTLNIKLAPARPVAPMGAAPLTKQALGFSVTHTPSN